MELQNFLNIDLWPTAYRNLLQSHHNPDEIRFWLDSLVWNGISKNENTTCVNLLAPDVFQAKFTTQLYKTQIEQSLSLLLGSSVEVSITAALRTDLDSSKKNVLDTTSINPLAPPRKLVKENAVVAEAHVQGSFKFTRTITDSVDPRQTFEKYIVGPSNQLAYASASSLISVERSTQTNPLFIYGPPGVGKTHLLHSIGNELKKCNPKIRVYFVSAEKFVNEYIESIPLKKSGEFRAKYRDLDLLLIDDIQFIVGKQHSTEEFLHTFNALQEMNKLIVLTSDQAPKKMEGLDERIKSRFEMCMVADIKLPEIETRVAILKAKAEADDVYLPDDVATFLGTYIKDSVRSLHGTLIRIQQIAALTGSEITLDLAKEILFDSIPENSQEFTVEVVIQAVCSHFGIKIKDLKGSSRKQEFAKPRQIAMYLIRKYSGLEYRSIGEIFYKDHSTVVHAYNKIAPALETNFELKKSVDSICEQF